MKNIKYLIIGIILFLSGCGGIEPVNDPPKIVLPEPEINIELDDVPFVYEWAFGEDEEDGKIPCEFDFTEVNFDVPGSYRAECTVTDSDGDTATSSFTITVEDQTPPTVQKMSSHQSVFKVDARIDFESNILIIDNYDEDLDVVIDDSAVVYNTPGTYDVEYTATDDAGNETSLVVEYTLTSKTMPTFTEEISVDQSHLLINYGVIDPDGAFIRLDVKVEKGGEEIMVDSFFDVTYEIDLPVPSNSELTVTLTYLYDVGGEQGALEKEEEIMSDSWEIPEIEIETEYVSNLDFELEVFYIDPDARVLDATLSISDEFGELYNFDIQFPEEFLVAVPFTGHDYTLVLTYTYDMDDGMGIHEVVVEETYQNPQLPVPTINILHDPGVVNSVILVYQAEGFEYIVSPHIEVGIWNSEGSMLLETMFFAPNEIAHIEFTNLVSGAEYIVRFSYEYDLHDGMGVQQAEYDYVTHTYLFRLISITPYHYELIVGEDLFIDIAIMNPNYVDVDFTEINGVEQYWMNYMGNEVYQITIPYTELSLGVNNFTITGIIAWAGPYEVFVAIDYSNTFSVTVIENPN